MPTDGSLLASLQFYSLALTLLHTSPCLQVSAAMKKAGLGSCDLIIGIDFTASNEWQGRKTFNGESLHSLQGNKIYNPYQRVIAILGETLEPFAGKKRAIPAFGFGDVKTQDHALFPLKDDWSSCNGFYEVLQCYNKAAARVILSGPTSFAPIIRKAIEVMKLKRTYYVLVIIADGQMRVEEPTIQVSSACANEGQTN